jgi:hypothetical protein
MYAHNYRVLRTLDGNFELVEVHYQDTLIIDIIRQPLFSAYVPGGEDKADIVQALRRAHMDARDKPVLDEAELKAQGHEIN